MTQPETGGWVDIQAVVDALYRIVVDEELGDGQILQVVQSGTTVQTHASEGLRKGMHSQTTLHKQIVQQLKTTGLDV